MRRVIYTPQAKQDINEIWDYYAPDNEEYAARLLRSIDDKCKLLASFPAMGREQNSLIIGLRSFTLGNFSIYYMTLEEGVEVLRVLHGARDVAAAFDEMIG